ncbi:30S ribosomal protein S5 [Candidatus Parcubacteria bacterium]|nr:30S ribosomal protein S5 [Candidatus Parcubacteria bacterium]
MSFEEKQYDERVLHVDRVARVVKGGRRFRFRALVAVGDRKGRIGVASAKGADVTAAVSKATDTAKKHFISVKLYNGTIPHEVQAKVGGANILLKPASPGTGLIAGGVVRILLEVGGVSNALSKSLGSSNKVNLAYATLDALQTLQTSDKWVTRQTKSAAESRKPKVESKAKASETKAESQESTKKAKPDKKVEKIAPKKGAKKPKDEASR